GVRRRAASLHRQHPRPHHHHDRYPPHACTLSNGEARRSGIRPGLRRRGRRAAPQTPADEDPMKFGINFFPAFPPSQKTTAEYYAQCLRVSERADELGFSSIKAVEHYFHDYGGHSPTPIVLLAAIASRTKRVRPITGAVIPAFNHPIKLAGELAMLDNISNGRLDVGFGPPFIPEE